MARLSAMDANADPPLPRTPILCPNALIDHVEEVLRVDLEGHMESRASLIHWGHTG